MKLCEFFKNSGRPFAYYPQFVHNFDISTNACILLCYIGWKTYDGQESEWLELTSEQITKDTGLSRKEQETARDVLVEKRLVEEYYARLQHVLKFRLIDNGETPNEEIPIHPKGESGIDESSNRLKGKESIKEKKERATKLSDEEFLNSLKAEFTWINLDAEISRMKAWLLNNPGRQLTRRFMVNWLNRIEKPVKAPELKWQPDYIPQPKQSNRPNWLPPQ